MKASERGSALLETILLGLLLFIPLLWGLGVLAELHRGALASTAAAREAGFDAVRMSDRAAGSDAIDEAVARAFRNHGLDPGEVRVTWTGDKDLRRGSAVRILIEYPVPVLSAPFLGRVSGPSIWVRAEHVARVDPYGSRE